MSTLIKFENVAKSFDTQRLYSSVNFKILSGEKVLVCGENGCGKTTLIRLMTGELEADTGIVYIDPKMAISKLEQWEPMGINNTVEDYIDNIFEHITSIEKRIEKLETAFAEEYSQTNIDEYTQLVDLFETLGGYGYLKAKDEFLHTFGLKKILNRKVNTLSGGEQQYLRLAATIFSEASLLVLDEPFTFLDKKKTTWLLNYLKDIKKTVVLISHDFYLAREFATITLNIRNWEIKKYKNGYDSFLEQSFLETTKQRQSNIMLDNYIAEREASIAKRKKWMQTAENKHRHAVMIRRLERNIEYAKNNKYEHKKINEFNISTMVTRRQSECEDLLIKLKNVTLQFDMTCILDAISLDIYANKHYIILGDNGVGKTSLLNLIMKNISPTKGEVVYTKKIIFASLSQYNANIENHNTCLDVLSKISNDSKDDLIEKYSEFFDFDFWDKRLSVLSGGELKRFFIFMSLLQDFDILILDEPTTFMDTYAKESIMKMIEICRKCVIIVTHDPQVFENMSGTKFIIRNGHIKHSTK